MRRTAVDGRQRARPISATIKGPPPLIGTGMPGQGFGAALSTLLSSVGSGPPNTNPISSLARLRQAVAAIATYDGLYASFPGHGKRRVYRNLSLLITGRTTLHFVVAR